MKTINLKIFRIDTGHCQITYQCKNEDNQSIYYCLQDNWRESPVRLLRATQPPWCEPEYECSFKNTSDKEFKFERPSGDSTLEIKANAWIDNFERTKS